MIKSSIKLLVVVDRSVAVLHAAVVVLGLPVGQVSARFVALHELVCHSLIRRVGRQHLQKTFCGKMKNYDFFSLYLHLIKDLNVKKIQLCFLKLTKILMGFGASLVQ